MKYAKTILILLVLFGLPAGSWYFLKYGSQWRKDKLESLVTKANFINSYGFTDQQKNELFAKLSYRTTVVSFGESLNERENKLIDQYKKSPTFQWMAMVSDSSDIIEYSSKNPRKYFVCNELKPLDEVLKDARYVLLDTSLNVRQVYHSSSEQTLSDLIEDIAIVLPRKVEKDISIRKPNND